MPAIEALLQHAAVEHVDITVNPIASIDSKEYITKLSPGCRKKLIFLLPQHLKTHVFDMLTNNDDTMSAELEHAHTSFYASAAYDLTKDA